MIRVTIELLPGGYEAGRKVLGIAEIANDGQDTGATDGRLGSYRVRLSKREPKVNEVWRRGQVHGFPRKRLGAWDLVYQALRACVGDRNPDHYEPDAETMRAAKREEP